MERGEREGVGWRCGVDLGQNTWATGLFSHWVEFNWIQRLLEAFEISTYLYFHGIVKSGD